MRELRVKQDKGPSGPERLRLAISGTGAIPLAVGLLAGLGILIIDFVGGSSSASVGLACLAVLCAVWLGIRESRGRHLGRRLRSVARWIFDLLL